MTRQRIAVASIIQETNTFSPRPSGLDDFHAQGLWLGEEARTRSAGSNTEIAGAIERLESAGVEVIPIIRAWAMSDGVLDSDSLIELEAMLLRGLTSAGQLDAVILCLHGALVSAEHYSADARLTEVTRGAVGPDVPVIVTHDLHANVTGAIVDSATALIGFHTYPHVDQGDTGRRAADLALAACRDGVRLSTVLVKCPMLIPAEAQAIADEPMASIRMLADALTEGEILDVSIFPVQPWLDVPELGFAVTVTHRGDGLAAMEAANVVAEAAWRARDRFSVPLIALEDALSGLVPSDGAGPMLLVQSADSPTAGATGDDASVIGALLARGPGLRSMATVVDVPGVDACTRAGVGGRVELLIGATIDDRWSMPVPMSGVVLRLGDDPVILQGESMTGQAIALGRWATVDTGAGLTVLISERPAPTFDPQGFRHVGLDPALADVVVVRSATMFRAGFRGIASGAIILDLPGASTPAFSYLTFERAPRPLYPLDADAEFTTGGEHG
jgi:microcystin degradation protein MlrC